MAPLLVLLALALFAGTWAGSALWPAAPTRKSAPSSPTSPAGSTATGVAVSPTTVATAKGTAPAAVSRPLATSTPTRVPATPTVPAPSVAQLTLWPAGARPSSRLRPLVEANGRTDVVWRVVRAARMYLDGTPIPSSGRRPVVLVRGAALVLSADNGHGAVVTRVLVVAPSPASSRSVLPPGRLFSPRVRRFAAQPDPGTGRALLRWDTRGASEVTLDGVRVARAGSRAVAATSATRHVLVAWSLLGSDRRMLDVPPLVEPPVLRVSPRPPTIADFTVTHPRSGQPYALRWDTTGAVKVLLDGQVVPASGLSPLPRPVEDHTYTLVARNPDGETYAALRVQVR